MFVREKVKCSDCRSNFRTHKCQYLDKLYVNNKAIKLLRSHGVVLSRLLTPLPNFKKT